MAEFVGMMKQDDLIFFLGSAVIFTLYRYTLQALILKILRNGGKNDKKAKKIAESCFKFTWYVSVSVAGYFAVYSEPFWTDTSLLWIGYPNIPISPLFRIYYMAQLGMGISNIFCHVSIEVKRKDFWVMFLHHMVTVILLAWSWNNNYCQAGGIILLLHDVTDVILELGKLFIYLNMKLVADSCFVVLIVMWGYNRLYIFPFKVMRTTIYESFDIIKEDPHGHLIPFNGFLFILLALNAYWMGLMVNMLIRIVFNKEQLNDTREKSSKQEQNSGKTNGLTNGHRNGGNEVFEENDKKKVKREEVLETKLKEE